MIWLIFWLALAVAILGFMGWSLNTLLRQKKAWADFAKRYKLEYAQAAFLQPSSVTGTLYNRKFNLYVLTEQTPGQRMMAANTHIEVFLNNLPDFALLVSARALPPILNDFVLPSTVTPNDPDWPKPAVSMTDDVEAATAWLTVPRIRAIRKLCELKKGAETLFVADGTQAYVVWRTPEAMDNLNELNRVVAKLYEIVKELDGPAAAQPPILANENSNGPSTTETPPA